MARNGLTFPDVLPITQRRDELVRLIGEHQVVIVAGETGSGKSTQLPKLCLAAGRGVQGLIGHTQPRRLAARTIAERVAEELGGPVGAAVGFTVRFTDRVGPDSLVNVMTDGILLAEIQRDGMLRRYDTIIVDEAHERSLNIDFILGYLKRLLPKRPDLKVIVTSATIDTARFSAHFEGAPVVEVTGRTYPVEVRYRPIGADRADRNDDDGEDDDDAGEVVEDLGRGGVLRRADRRRVELEPAVDDPRDQVQAIIDAVDELSAEGPGDILVFLSGEREIHDAADALRRLELANTEVLPLYARLATAEQHRIFQPHTGRRVVLSTNVAETSLTVPGIRYVIDTGVARISRYSLRLKVQRLPIEPISQASANQRAGRCGRVAPGVCIRLYGAEDFAARPAFTEPEILRTNLASIILQMTAIGLGDIDAFPFLEPPDRRAVRDGHALLDELGALTLDDRGGADRASGVPAARRLTPIGRRLARLPVDPRLGRMVLEAERHGCVREVLVIAAALSIQDPRERPTEKRAAADEAHARFNASGSDFLAYVALWDHLRERQRELSSSQFRKLCRAEFLNYLRVREWQDLYSQLRQVAGDVGVRGDHAAHPDHVHQALLAGLLSHLGVRDPVGREFRGAHGSKFVLASGSVLAKKPPQWVMAGELVETNRLQARTLAAVRPEWAEKVAAHLTKSSYGDPEWDERSGRAVVLERVSLYGLPIVPGRRIGFDRVDRAGARDMFIHHALVEGEWQTHHAFVADNRKTVEQVRGLEERVRRGDLVDADALFRFYDERVGPDVVSGRHFDQWWRREKARQPDLLRLQAKELLARKLGDRPLDDFPITWTQGELRLAITYRFEPGASDDGVTVHVPLEVLNRVRADGFDWQVPGLRSELLAALVKTLPKEIRRELVPAAETIAAATELIDPAHGALAESFAKALTAVAPITVEASMFDQTRVADHLRITFAVHDADQRIVARGKNLDALRRELGSDVQAAIAAVSPVAERSGITTWDLGTVPRVVEIARGSHTVRGYPALLDTGTSVSLRVFTNEALQTKVMAGGLRRLLLLTAAPAAKQLERTLDNATKLAIARQRTFTLADLVEQCTTAAIDTIVREEPQLAFDADAFDALAARGRREAFGLASHALALACEIVAAATTVEAHLAALVAPTVRPSADDARAHLRRLVRPGFVVTAGVDRLADVLRYTHAIDRRVARIPEDVGRDLVKMRAVHALEGRYVELGRRYEGQAVPPEVLDLRWLLEELCVNQFAESLGTKVKASVQRVSKELAALGG